MKTYFPTFVIALLFFSSCSREFNIISSDVPAPVLSGFQSKYPDAKDVSWEAEKEDGHLVFEAEWKVNGKEKEAVFKPDGTFLKEED
jgi:hypothetical protein